MKFKNRNFDTEEIVDAWPLVDPFLDDILKNMHDDGLIEFTCKIIRKDINGNHYIIPLREFTFKGPDWEIINAPVTGEYVVVKLNTNQYKFTLADQFHRSYIPAVETKGTTKEEAKKC